MEEIVSGELKYNNIPILRYPAREITPPQVDISHVRNLWGEGDCKGIYGASVAESLKGIGIGAETLPDEPGAAITNIS